MGLSCLYCIGNPEPQINKQELQTHTFLFIIAKFLHRVWVGYQIYLMKETLLTVAFTCISLYGYSQYKQPTQYRDLQQLDISALGNAMTTKQYRYNNNVARVQNNVNKISDYLRSLEISDERKSILFSAFESKCLKQIPSINYSSDIETDQLVKFLYDCVNYQLKNN